MPEIDYRRKDTSSKETSSTMLNALVLQEALNKDKEQHKQKQDQHHARQPDKPPHPKQQEQTQQAAKQPIKPAALPLPPLKPEIYKQPALPSLQQNAHSFLQGSMPDLQAGRNAVHSVLSSIGGELQAQKENLPQEAISKKAIPKDVSSILGREPIRQIDVQQITSSAQAKLSSNSGVRSCLLPAAERQDVLPVQQTFASAAKPLLQLSNMQETVKVPNVYDTDVLKAIKISGSQETATVVRQDAIKALNVQTSTQAKAAQMQVADRTPNVQDTIRPSHIDAAPDTIGKTARSQTGSLCRTEIKPADMCRAVNVHPAAEELNRRDIDSYKTAATMHRSTATSRLISSVLPGAAQQSVLPVKTFLPENSSLLEPDPKEDTSELNNNAPLKFGDKRYALGAEIALVALTAAAGASRRRIEPAANGRAEQNETGQSRAADTDADGSNKVSEAISFPPRQRPTMLIGNRDNLIAIAERRYDDANLSWLIAQLNRSVSKQIELQGKYLVEFESRQEIVLPVWDDIVDFYQVNRKRQFDNSRLITIVKQTIVDQELLEATLGHLFQKY